MPYKPILDNNAFRNRSFRLFMFSQGVSNLGDVFQLIAATSLLVKITGSGLSAAYGLICGPVLYLLLSAFAGYISDAKQEKTLLVIIDLLRGLVVLLFMSKNGITETYILITALSALDVFYNPPRKKFLAGMLRNNQLISGNSLLNGLSGGMFIIGPALAGLVIGYYGTNIAFLFNSLSFFISALTIVLIEYKTKRLPIKKRRISPSSVISSLKEGAAYSLDNYELRSIIFTGTIICSTTTAVNITFYPFAFDILKISSMEWGIMMSIFYGASMLAMPVSLLLKFSLNTFIRCVIPALLLVFSIIWFQYGSINKLSTILLLQLAEGTLLAYINIMFTSSIQSKSEKEILGRVIGISDFINNLGKLLGIICTYALLEITQVYNVFRFCSAIVLLYALYTVISCKRWGLREI